MRGPNWIKARIVSRRMLGDTQYVDLGLFNDDNTPFTGSLGDRGFVSTQRLLFGEDIPYKDETGYGNVAVQPAGVFKVDGFICLFGMVTATRVPASDEVPLVQLPNELLPETYGDPDTFQATYLVSDINNPSIRGSMTVQVYADGNVTIGNESPIGVSPRSMRASLYPVIFRAATP